MIMLLAFPVIAAVALAHRCLLLYAPSNVLIRRVRGSRPTLRTVAAMLALAASVTAATKVLSDAVAAGAPGWLNVVVLALAWDAIKMGWLAIAVFICWLSRVVRRTIGHLAGVPGAPTYS